MTTSADGLVECLSATLSEELARQYDNNPRWDDAKTVVEEFDVDAFARRALTALSSAGWRMVAVEGEALKSVLDRVAEPKP